MKHYQQVKLNFMTQVVFKISPGFGYMIRCNAVSVTMHYILDKELWDFLLDRYTDNAVNHKMMGGDSNWSAYVLTAFHRLY